MKKLYNVLMSVEDGVQLRLLPDDDSGPVIAVVGVKTTVPVESVTALVLIAVLRNLAISADLVRGWLVENKGDDYWSMDGGN